MTFYRMFAIVVSVWGVDTGGMNSLMTSTEEDTELVSLFNLLSHRGSMVTKER